MLFTGGAMLFQNLKKAWKSNKPGEVEISQQK
jgi:hypothetical protein